LITYEFFLPQKEEDEYKKNINPITDIDDCWYEIESNFLRKYTYKIYVGDPV